jgi:3-oxoadipate enol-lactonase
MEKTSQAVDLHVAMANEDGPGIPTVLIHGVGSELSVWDRVLESLPLSSPIVRYDLRGHGRSQRPPGPYSLENFVDDHVVLMQKLGITRANVVGFSLGGLIAQAVALRHPDTVERLVIIGAVAGRSDAEKEAVLSRLRVVEDDGLEAIASGGATRWYTEDFRTRHPEVVERHMQRFTANDPRAYAAAFRVLATNDLLPDLHEIQVPTLIMTGSEDVGSPPRMARAMHASIADSELVIIDGVKHAVLEETPDKVAGEIARFLSSEPGLHPAGLGVRREVLGAEYVDRALSREDAISQEFQSFITKYCWAEVWTDDRLSRRERSLLNLGMTAALGRMAEFEAHTRGALRNGVSPDELASVLKQITVYCGVPAGVAASAVIRAIVEAEASK